jgi:hypothetical protein
MLLQSVVRILAGEDPTSYLWGSLSVKKRLKRELDHSSPSDAEVKNEWSYTYAPPSSRAFMTWIGINFSVFIYL